uniref:Uncharacterized protein n=1 Tax=Knipowitschia caucasica TaxID=637954 RepID=A0AAV2M4L9_KNICA
MNAHGRADHTTPGRSRAEVDKTWAEKLHGENERTGKEWHGKSKRRGVQFEERKFQPAIRYTAVVQEEG